VKKGLGRKPQSEEEKGVVHFSNTGQINKTPRFINKSVNIQNRWTLDSPSNDMAILNRGILITESFDMAFE
jgi:hypothetical protein